MDEVSEIVNSPLCSIKSLRNGEEGTEGMDGWMDE